MNPVSAAWSFAIAVGAFIVFAAVIEAAKRRGFDFVARVADVLAPRALTPEPVQ